MSLAYFISGVLAAYMMGFASAKLHTARRERRARQRFPRFDIEKL